MELPKDIENIIIDYKNQMEHIEKFKLTLNEINKISHEISPGGDTYRTYGSRRVYYCGGLSKADTLLKSTYDWMRW